MLMKQCCGMVLPIILVGCSEIEASSPSRRGIPYGFWGLNGFINDGGLQEVQETLNTTIFHTATMDPTYAVHVLLPMVRNAGLQVTLRLTGDHHHYTTEAGDFSLEAWTAVLSRWAGAPLEPFIADGTLAGHMLLDDIENFGSHDPDAAELDEMARYSKALFPDLMTFVRQNATEMPQPDGDSYLYVDAVVNQYRAVEGPAQDYARAQAARSAELNVGVIMGMNIADGGDGSSGQPGWREGRFAMSAAELRAYGRHLSAVPECGMFLNWEYDAEEPWSDGSLGADYFSQPAQQAALAQLGQRLSRRDENPIKIKPYK
jgi:hypothetical protein